MRPEIKAAVEALHALENVTIEEFGLIRVEVDLIEDRIKETECKKIFDEQVCKSNNILLKTFLKEHNITSISFANVKADDEFISSVVFNSADKSIAFHINSSDCPDFITTHNSFQINAYIKDAQNVRENIGIDISYFTNGEIEAFLDIIETFSKDAYSYGLFVEFE